MAQNTPVGDEPQSERGKVQEEVKTMTLQIRGQCRQFKGASADIGVLCQPQFGAAGNRRRTVGGG
jgi:hypothetical protein